MSIPAAFVSHAGSCRCGQVQFCLRAAPIITLCCHCRFCQKLSGSAFRIAAMIEAEHVRVVAGVPTESVGEGGHEVWHCPACCCALWSHHPKLGAAIAFVAVGTLERAEELPPEVHYFTRSKHPWVTLVPQVPAFVERGDPGKPGVAARMTAALARSPAQSLQAWTQEAGEVKRVAAPVPPRGSPRR